MESATSQMFNVSLNQTRALNLKVKTRLCLLDENLHDMINFLKNVDNNLLSYHGFVLVKILLSLSLARKKFYILNDISFLS